MAFANGTTTVYFPIAGSAGASLWGTDVRKVLSSPDATADATTICNHGTSGGAQNRTCDPYTTTTADLTEADYGWAIQPTDMGSVSGSERMIPAGNHVFSAHVSTSSLTGSTVDVKFTAHRVGPAAGRTRSTIATTTSVGLTFGNTATGGSDITVTLACPEIVFADDETLQYSLEFSSPGVAITGKTTILNTGTASSNATRVVFPAMKTIAQTQSALTGSGILATAAGLVIGATVAMTGTGTLAATQGATGAMISALTGSATLAATMGAIAGTTSAMAGTGALNANVGKIIGTTGDLTVAGGGGDTFIRPIFIFDD